MERGETRNRYPGPGDLLNHYLSMPKHFVGPETADNLFKTYDALTNIRHPKAFHFLVAGSAAAESGIVGTHLSAQERHYRIQCAHYAWEHSKALSVKRRRGKYDSGEWTKSKLLMFSDHVDSQLIYTNLFHDLVNKNVRSETIGSVHERLVKLGVTNLKRYIQALEEKDFGAARCREGFAYEISTTAAVTRLRSPTFFAIPAVVRSDNGIFLPEDTHDVQLIKQKWGTIRSAIPVEVKRSDARGEIHSARYKSMMIQGTIHLNMPSAETPLHLAYYLDKELRGQASRQEIKELNEITSSVLNEATSYIQRLGLGSRALAANY